MPDPRDMILCESVLLSTSLLPAVKISIGKTTVTVPVQDARNFAINLLEAAEGAETDLVIFRDMNLSAVNAAALIRRRREYRKHQ